MGRSHGVQDRQRLPSDRSLAPNMTLPGTFGPCPIGTVRTSTALQAAKLAFELLVLTAARWGEVRWAGWREIDRGGRMWTIPTKRMKANRQHRAPLCGCALNILEAARTLGKGSRSGTQGHRTTAGIAHPADARLVRTAEKLGEIIARCDDGEILRAYIWSIGAAPPT